MKERMNMIMVTLKKWTIIWLTIYQTTTPPKWMFSQKLLFKSSLLQNGKCGIQVRPPNNSDDLCLTFCLYAYSMRDSGTRKLTNYLGSCGVWRLHLNPHYQTAVVTFLPCPGFQLIYISPPPLIGKQFFDCDDVCLLLY